MTAQQGWLQLFDDYQRAFNSGQAQDIAACYHQPCIIADGDGEQAFSSVERLVAKFSANCDALRTMGYQSAEFSVVNDFAMGNDARAIKLRWNIRLESTDIDMCCMYICRLTDEGWRIFCANVYQNQDEAEHSSLTVRTPELDVS